MLPDKLRRMPVLPKRYLYPLWLLTPVQRREQRAAYDAASATGKVMIGHLRAIHEQRNDQDRPARTQSTRRRLTAAYWEGWSYGWRSPDRWMNAPFERPLWQGPTWLGSNRPGKPAFWRGMFAPRASW